MKKIKSRLGAYIGLIVVCLLPMGARAAEHHLSGIIGFVEAPGFYNVLEVFDGTNYIAAQIDSDGFFEVDLKPGNYVLTPWYIPEVVPGQPTPNYVIRGPSIPVKVPRHHFTFVEIPVQPLLFPPSASPRTPHGHRG